VAATPRGGSVSARWPIIKGTACIQGAGFDGTRAVLRTDAHYTWRLSEGQAMGSCGSHYTPSPN